MLTAHLEREHLGDHPTLLTDVEERYGLPEGALTRRVAARASGVAASGLYDDRVPEYALEEEKARVVLREHGPEREAGGGGVRAERGELVLGGCMAGAPGGDPTHRCLECGVETADNEQE